jgi:hypothetical protein
VTVCDWQTATKGKSCEIEKIPQNISVIVFWLFEITSSRKLLNLRRIMEAILEKNAVSGNALGRHTPLFQDIQSISSFN